MANLTTVFNASTATLLLTEFVTTSSNSSKRNQSAPDFVGEDIHPIARKIFIGIGILEVAGGVLGNLLLLTVLLLRRSIVTRNFHNIFIANLALADLLSQGYWMPFFVLDLILGYHPVLNDLHCDANALIVSVCVAVTVLTLLTISLNRWLHVCHASLYSRIFTKRRIKICCVSTWVLAATFGTPPLLGIGSYHYDRSSHTCNVSTAPEHVYINVIVVMICLMPMCLIGYWNFAIFRHWKKARMSLRAKYPMLPAERTRRQSLMQFRRSVFELGRPSTRNRESRGETVAEDVTRRAGDAQNGASPSLRGRGKQKAMKNGERQRAEGIQDGAGQRDSSAKPDERESVIESDDIQDPRLPQPPTLKAVEKRLRRKRRKEQARDEAFVRTLFVVFLLVAVTFTPYAALTILGSASVTVPAEVVIASTLLLFSNCAVNWIVYGVMNRSFRRGYVKNMKRVLGTCCRRQCPSFFEEDTNLTTTYVASSMRSITDGDYSFPSPEESTRL